MEQVRYAIAPFVMAGAFFGFLLPLVTHHYVTSGMTDPDAPMRMSRDAVTEFPDPPLLPDGYVAAMLRALDDETDPDYMKLHVVHRSRNAAQVIADTWGRQLSPTYHVRTGNDSSADFLLDTLCADQGPDWSVVVNETTYVNPFVLRHFLRRKIGTSEPVVLGSCGQEPCVDGIGMLLLSRAARDDVCRNSHRDQLSGVGLHLTDEGCVLEMLCRRSEGIENYFDLDEASDSLDRWPLRPFITPVVKPDQLYTIHDHILDAHAQSLVELISKLGESSDDESSQRLKRESATHSPSPIGVPFPNYLTSDTGRPTQNFIDSTDRLFVDSCVVKSKSLHRSKSYLEAKDTVRRQFNLENSEDFFGYQLDKPNAGREFHLYHVNGSQSHRAIATQDLDRPRIVTKHAQRVQDLVLYVLLPGSDPVVLRGLLAMIQRAVEAIPNNVKLVTRFPEQPTPESIKVVLEFDFLNVTVREQHENLVQYLRTVAADLSPDTVVAHLPDHTVFSPQFLPRCLSRTRRGASAYFPVPFERRDLKSSTDLTDIRLSDWWRVTEAAGTWRSDVTDIFCVSVGDARQSLLSYGRDMMESVRSLGISAYRTPDPGLRRL